MNSIKGHLAFFVPSLLSAWAILLLPSAGRAADEPAPLTLVVMDPLAAPLACDCVEGYAQRDYEALGEFLQGKIGRKVNVVFKESLIVAKRELGQIDLAIGKDPIIQYDSKKAKLKMRLIAALTDKSGDTMFTGLVVVPAGDPAKSLKDLDGYHLLFGPAEATEKHGAAVAALEAAGVTVPEASLRKTVGSCSEAGLACIEAFDKSQDAKTAAVISSYAMALLEGCGTVDPGSLRVIGETEPVPFIRVYADRSLDRQQRKAIMAALKAVSRDAELCTKLESKNGFKVQSKGKEQEPEKKKRSPGEIEPDDEPAATVAPAASNTAAPDWTQWRGPGRDGIVPSLPETLPAEPTVVWTAELTSPGLAGVVVADGRVLTSGRDPYDVEDVFTCLDAATGKTLWTLNYRATGELDYGNSPRSTPLVADGRAFLLGAMGHLHCVAMADGKVIWKTNLTTDFAAAAPQWGYSASPILVDGKLIVQPGAEDASLVALDPASGKVLWKSPGAVASYASPMVANLGGVRQLVTYDKTTLGGWDIATGKRLWSLTPPEPGDFNVPTPVDLGDGRLLVTSENNGTRVYAFDDKGVIRPEPVAKHWDLAPDSSTPVLVGKRAIGAWYELYCLDTSDELAECWVGENDAFEDYASLIADRDGRVLITACDGRLLLVDGKAGEFAVLSDIRILPEGSEILAHPAIVGDRLFIRGVRDIRCLDLSMLRSAE